MRDWSKLGQAERDLAYGPVLSALENEFPADRENIKVLVPGCGLGRLVWECYSRGFNTEGPDQIFAQK